MNTQLQNLINRQRQRMRDLRDDAHDLANTVADEVWDKFEVEIEEVTADGFMFDLATNTQMALCGMLALSYDEAFEHHVLDLFERQENELREGGASETDFDSARISLTGLRKSLKLRTHADDLIGQAIERAKPGLIGMLLLSSDPCSDAWDRELNNNASRLRKNLLGLREKIIESIREETRTIIQTARLGYVDMLDTLSGKVDASQSNPGAA
ncbi:hypothetical protein R2083_10590 [Nitrosomonas sp. Is35]|uniref:hypothetical protein n=1 Tax=Nitrosomonas sp. Is35 TaxID=3080534 RepID=UPI00294B4159|nr:hypothetical protein [Nitrosomonas sp. Is35]MDV6347959.1 hypothetical protein [Nitrosomonas sp. Is35]